MRSVRPAGSRRWSTCAIRRRPGRRCWPPPSPRCVRQHGEAYTYC